MDDSLQDMTLIALGGGTERKVSMKKLRFLGVSQESKMSHQPSNAEVFVVKDELLLSTPAKQITRSE